MKKKINLFLLASMVCVVFLTACNNNGSEPDVEEVYEPEVEETVEEEVIENEPEEIDEEPEEDIAEETELENNSDFVSEDFDINNPETLRIEFDGVSLAVGMTVDELLAHMDASERDEATLDNVFPGMSAGTFSFRTRANDVQVATGIINLSEEDITMREARVSSFSISQTNASWAGSYFIFSPEVVFSQTTPDDIRDLFGEPTTISDQTEGVITYRFSTDNRGGFAGSEVEFMFMDNPDWALTNVTITSYDLD